jgi:hypothetical protein
MKILSPSLEQQAPTCDLFPYVMIPNQHSALAITIDYVGRAKDGVSAQEDKEKRRRV